MAINKKLIHFKNKLKFNEELAKGNILETSIVFILDTTEIYTHGSIYDGNTFDPSDIEASILNIIDTKAEKSELPTKTSDLINDSGYLTEQQDISHLATREELNSKQDKLVSGTNIKTINGTSILGSGDIVINNDGGSSSGNCAYPEINHGTSDTTFTLTPNTFHVWDEVTTLNLDFGEETEGVANEFLFQFNSGTEATTLTLPDTIKWVNDSIPTIKMNMIYQVSILKGLASVLEFSNSIVFPIIDSNSSSNNEEYAKVYEYFVNTYDLTNAGSFYGLGVNITESLYCNDPNYGGYVIKVGLSFGGILLLWTQKAIDDIFVPSINNLGVYNNMMWGGGGSD